MRPWRAALAAGVFAPWIGIMFERVLGFALHQGLWGRAILSALGLH
ncbi:MAG: hypothetical protein IE927_01455 [Rhodobacterales bacterium]|nr:hypothetical protein [Rhodobacterales bacterium]